MLDQRQGRQTESSAFEQQIKKKRKQDGGSVDLLLQLLPGQDTQINREEEEDAAALSHA